ncbi:MAG: hypothetical protein ACK6DI_01400 [Betaproteobacteria bacterium]|jgi:hypothetical protein
MKNFRREERIREFYNQIDPARPIVFDGSQEPSTLGAEVYVPDLHADEFDVPRRSLRNAIERNLTAERYYFSGMRGSGKTTELRKLQAELVERGWVVFYVDLSEYLPLNAPVEIGDFLLVVVTALADEAQGRYGEDFKHRGGLERLADFLRSEVKIEGIDWSVDTLVGKLGFKAKIKDNPAFKEKLQEVTNRSIDRLVAECREFVDGVVSFVRQETGKPDGRVLLIVDSVERLQGIGDQAKLVFDAVENLFGVHRDKLRFHTLDVVYSVPPHVSAVVAAGGRVLSLPMVKVFEKPQPNGHRPTSEQGINKLLAVVDRRSTDWRELIDEPQMRELARVSGGDIREMFSLARETLNLLDPDDNTHFPAPPAAIERCKQLRRNQFGTIPSDRMDWLKRVVRTHEHGLRSLDELDTLAQLLDGKLILKYRNGEDWYDVHPLLWDAVERHVESAG